MSQNQTTPQKAAGSAMPANPQVPTTPKAAPSQQQIIPINAEEVPRLPTVSQVFEKIQQGLILQESHESFSFKLKDLCEFERIAKEETGFLIQAILPNGRKFEFNHLPSNLAFVSQQVEKGKAYLESLEVQIQNFKIS